MNHLMPHRFDALINNQLSESEQQHFEKHLDQCSACRQKLENLVADQSEWELAARHLADSNELAPSEWMVNNETVSIVFPADAEIQDLDQPASWTSPLEPATHPENLGSIDGFEIEKEIGRGGCGVVYRGFDRELNRPVAIKVLAPHLASSGIARQRFAREGPCRSRRGSSERGANSQRQSWT